MRHREHELKRCVRGFDGASAWRSSISRSIASCVIRSQILNLLVELKKRFDLSYIFISHDLAVIEHVSDRLAVMYLGRIVETAATEDLFARPSHPYTEALMSAVPRPDPQRRT
jgi:ABC-type oligopeptide transport system ATPase subunit